MTKPRSKYGAKPTTLYGIRFASKFEGETYLWLRDRQARGEITGLTCHVNYPLCVDGERIAIYVADFVFKENGKEVALESKGMETPVWKLKKRHFLAQYKNVELRVVKPGQALARAA